MPLPQQVIDRLSREPVRTPGWSLGVFTFSGGIFAIAVITYLGLVFGYEPYLDSQISQVDTQIQDLSKTISADDQAKLVTFYSQITNLKSAIANHVSFSHFLSWFEKRTVATVYYSSFSFQAGNQITLTGRTKSQADVEQQVKIFETDPAVKVATLSNTNFSDTDQVWQFTMTLTMDPAAGIFSAAPAAAAVQTPAATSSPAQTPS